MPAKVYVVDSQRLLAEDVRAGQHFVSCLDLKEERQRAIEDARKARQQRMRRTAYWIAAVVWIGTMGAICGYLFASLQSSGSLPWQS